MKVGTCSGALMTVLDRAFGHPMAEEERAVMPLAGGIAQQGYQCGMLWGAALAAGAEAFRRYGSGPQTERAAMAATKRLVHSFVESNKYIDCLEITDTDWTNKLSMMKNFLKGGPITCLRKSANFSHVAFKEIDAALSEESVETPSCGSCSVSCASKLAKRVGLSDMHAVMAAGFAGGIGLSGGACGALGAAIWINEMTHGKAGDDYSAVNAKAGELIEVFLKHTDYEFECSEIVGQKFETIDAHAAHVQGGGCSKIIEALARHIEERESDTHQNDGKAREESRLAKGA
jgi:C_GCAxxG_C_C family probable redox protein